MPTRVRSFSKINLGLAIGPARADGFHALTTMYQTLALHDVVTVSAVRAAKTAIVLTSNHAAVPRDGRNTAWKMVERCLARMGVSARVEVHIEKNLPVQGGMGAGSANAAAALMGLEKELGLALPGTERLRLAAEVGSDVPLFLLGGAVLGLGRGEEVYPLPDLPETVCVVALPETGVSTPQAFADGDRLTKSTDRDTLNELSCALASLYAEPGTSGIFCRPGTESLEDGIELQGRHEKKAGEFDQAIGQVQEDPAENTLLALVHAGAEQRIENDFEKVVFPIHPSLGEIKQALVGDRQSEAALYAALSGSGSALFGLYRFRTDAEAAQQRVKALGCKAVITHTLPRTAYWRTMFAG